MVQVGLLSIQGSFVFPFHFHDSPLCDVPSLVSHESLVSSFHNAYTEVIGQQKKKKRLRT
jgi:hypothetical protein